MSEYHSQRVKIHLIGICGTGMGCAGRLAEGFGSRRARFGFGRVSADVHPARRAGHRGEERLSPRKPRLGPRRWWSSATSCSKDHPEVVAATARSLRLTSFPALLEDLYLHDHARGGDRRYTRQDHHLLARVLRPHRRRPRSLVPRRRRSRSNFGAELAARQAGRPPSSSRATSTTPPSSTRARSSSTTARARDPHQRRARSRRHLRPPRRRSRTAFTKFVAAHPRRWPPASSPPTRPARSRSRRARVPRGALPGRAPGPHARRARGRVAGAPARDRGTRTLFEVAHRAALSACSTSACPARTTWRTRCR